MLGYQYFLDYFTHIFCKFWFLLHFLTINTIRPWRKNITGLITCVNHILNSDVKAYFIVQQHGGKIYTNSKCKNFSGWIFDMTITIHKNFEASMTPRNFHEFLQSYTKSSYINPSFCNLAINNKKCKHHSLQPYLSTSTASVKNSWATKIE